MSQETIVITEEKVHPDAVALLKGYRLCYTGARFTQEDLTALVRREQPVGILFRYGRITEQVLLASQKLRVIGRHGVGMDAIDREAAKRLDIQAIAAVGSNSQAVAELALCLILACARHISWLDRRMHEGHWDKQSYQGFELSGAMLGVVGCGSIGARVVRFAQAIGMRVMVCDPYLQVDQLPEGVQKVELEELLTSSDVVSLHCPLDESTRNMLDAHRLDLLRKGAIVVNTARAGILDEVAMRKKLQAHELYLGLDCFVDEPIDTESPWTETPNAILTPHIGGTTNGGLRGMAVGAARSILSVLER
ncbi:D-3-phosphoglycerate dehydrogenase [Bordetella ansorpii]|uniref:D-3-phosphoglycerate dehydrogenase n=1 Tax=Bordetella ansorpii TaxID=288768 RepID=A0A157SH13_9BORD|nr:NAD(P)-dependent oxidoreductase [Bordetella ansorpii]SAI69624.1 D-3-phosphoglycerate dehydrogenase [Bordetella ansorpii]